MTDVLPISSHIDFVSLLKNSQIPQEREDKLGKTAVEFEAMLMTQLFQTMRKTVEPSGFFGGNQNERSTYEYLLDQAVVQQAIESGHTWGLAERIEESWRMFQPQAEGGDV